MATGCRATRSGWTRCRPTSGWAMARRQGGLCGDRIDNGPGRPAQLREDRLGDPRAVPDLEPPAHGGTGWRTALRWSTATKSAQTAANLVKRRRGRSGWGSSFGWAATWTASRTLALKARRTRRARFFDLLTATWCWPPCASAPAPALKRRGRTGRALNDLLGGQRRPHPRRHAEPQPISPAARSLGRGLPCWIDPHRRADRPWSCLSHRPRRPPALQRPSVQTAIGGQVNLVNTGGMAVNFWGRRRRGRLGQQRHRRRLWNHGRRRPQLDHRPSGVVIAAIPSSPGDFVVFAGTNWRWWMRRQRRGRRRRLQFAAERPAIT